MTDFLDPITLQTNLMSTVPAVLMVIQTVAKETTKISACGWYVWNKLAGPLEG